MISFFLIFGDVGQALRSAAASQRSASTASLSDELRKSFADSYSDYFPPPDYLTMRSLSSHDKLARGVGGGGGGGGGGSSSNSATGGVGASGSSPLPGAVGGVVTDSGDDDADLVPPCGPIRIRNLEDLIRQLERHR